MPSIINTSRIAIVGLGQLGGSLALRFREISCISLFGIARREETIKIAVERDMIDAGSTDPGDILPVVDITFLCLPLTASIEFARCNSEHFRPSSIVTDVGSVKEVIVREIRPVLLEKKVLFIGSHPMAGSEKSGIASSRADLYEDAVVFLTPTPEDESLAIDLIGNFWRDIGGRPIEIDAKRHDRVVAHSSHLPHLIAAAICKNTLAEGDVEAQKLACAGGFRDTTRIASGGSDMWTEITRHNDIAILDAITSLQSQIKVIKDLIEQRNWERLNIYLNEARSLRDTWIQERFGE